MVSHSKDGKKKPRVVSTIASAAAAISLAAAGIFIIAPAANAADVPTATSAAATTTDAPAAQDPAPASPAATPADVAPATTSSNPAPAAPAPKPAPEAAAPEPATPAGSDTPTGPTTTAGPAPAPAAPAPAAPAVAAKLATQTSNDNGNNNGGYNNPPKDKVCTDSGSLSWTRNSHLSEATVTLKSGYTSCDVALHSYATEGSTWETSGNQTFVDFAVAHLTKKSPTATLSVQTQGCYQQQDLNIGTKRYDGNDGSLPHYPSSNVPTGLLDHWNGKSKSDCTPPPVKEHVSGNVAFTDTVCDATTPVGNSAVVTLDGKTTATYTLNGGATQALSAGTLNDSVIGQNGYPAVVHIVLTGEDDSTLVFDHTFAAPKSESDCTPLTAVHPEGPIFHDSCGVSDDSFTVPGTLVPGSTITVTDPETGDVTTFSEYANDQGGYNVSDTTTKDGVRTVQVTFIPLGPAPVAEPGDGDTYTLVTIGGIKYAQWTYTFTSEPCPVTIIPTPPAPTVNAPTCTADGSLPSLQDGDGYTAAYNRKFDGPGKYTAIYTAVAGASFKDGKTVSYDLTVAGKLTENCPTSTPTPTPTHSTTPPTTTSSTNGGANTGLDGREPGMTASSANTVNPVALWSGIALLALALLSSAIFLIRRQRNQGGVEAQ